MTAPGSDVNSKYQMIVEDEEVAGVPARGAIAGFTSALSYLVLASGIITLLFTLFVTIRSYSPVWLEDQWTANAGLLLFSSGHRVQFLWQQHNEHRIPILKVLSMADIYLFHGRNVLLYICSWAIQISMLVLSIYAVIKFGKFSPSERRTIFGLLAFCVFNPAQLENFTWAFQMVFFLVFFSALASIFCLAIYSQRTEQQPDGNHTVLLWLCVGAALFSEFSIAAGVICWVILPFCIELLGLKRALWRPIVVFGVAAVGIYLIGYHSPEGHTSPLIAIQRPFEIVTYVQTLFGSSWDHLSRGFGMFVSPIAILFVAGTWITGVFRRGQGGSRLYAISLSMSMLCLLTAIMTALGRLNFGANQAAESRYQTPAMLFWCFGAIAFLTMPGIIPQRRSRRFVAIQLACLALFAFQAKAYSTIVAAYDAMTFSHNIGGLVVESGVAKEEVKNIFPTLQPIEWYRSMRAKGFGPPVFPEYDHVGDLLTSSYHVAPPSRCEGFLTSIQIVDGNRSEIRALGWTSVPSIFEQRLTILLTANDGRIVGLGVTGWARPDIAAAGLLPAYEINSGWYGLARVSPEERTIQAYKELPGGKEVCLLSGQKTIGQ